MNLIITIFLLIFSAFLYKFLAIRYKIIDKPNHRSSHAKPTIRGGGTLFLIAIWIFFVTSGFQYPLFCLGVTLIGIVSFVDDLRTLSPKFRLLVQLLSVALVLLELEFGVFGVGLFIGLLIISVLFINIYNFMDGINGITGLYSIAVLIGVFAVNYNEHIINSDLLIFSFLSLIVFGYFNFRRKAIMFAGDIGSISIAMLVLFCVLFLMKSLAAPILLLLVVVYGVDALITMVYRVYLKEKITDAHRHHIYQKLIDTFKYSHLKISSVYVLLQLCINAIVFLNYKQSMQFQYVVLFSIICVLIFLYIIVFIKNEKLKKA
jgi:UDP-N-acetylmuramyl pentapeptide phosphotransferase/UDP-N-acetylglucosamine-1-phosphate transferase